MSDTKKRRSAFLFCFILALIPVALSGQQTDFGDDILDAVGRFGQAEVSIVYPGFGEMTRLSQTFSVSTCNAKTAVLCLTPLTARTFIEKNIAYSLIKPDLTKGVYTASSVKEAMRWHSYPTFTQYDSIVHILSENYPGLCMLDTIGVSVNGKNIYALRIYDSSTTAGYTPRVFLSAAIHGDELCGYVLLLRLAEKLLSDARSDDYIRSIVSNVEVWINPLSNPDGMYNSGDAIGYPTRANVNYTDLNRDFPDPEVKNVIQPENKAMIAFLKEHLFNLSVSFHSGNEVVNYPWDRWVRLHPDDEWFNAVSRRYADTVHLHSQPGYMTDLDNGVTNGAAWYMINGGRQDYVTWSLGGREVTIELDKDKLTPADDLENLWNYNYRSMLAFIKESLSGVQGAVHDSLTGDPVRAEVYIKSHDADSSMIFSDSIKGNYIRLISPGSWDIMFTASGYENYLAENVAVGADESTNLNVALTKIKQHQEKMIVYPVPSDSEVKILLPDNFTGTVRFRITDSSGRLADSFNEVYSGMPLRHDFRNLPSGVYFISAKELATNRVMTSKMVIVRENN